jgi:hypothetical protein
LGLRRIAALVDIRDAEEEGEEGVSGMYTYDFRVCAAEDEENGCYLDVVFISPGYRFYGS